MRKAGVSLPVQRADDRWRSHHLIVCTVATVFAKSGCLSRDDFAQRGAKCRPPQQAAPLRCAAPAISDMLAVQVLALRGARDRATMMDLRRRGI
jgi:hypothetical protein